MSALNEKQRKLYERMKKNHVKMGDLLDKIANGLEEGTIDGEKFEELISKMHVSTGGGGGGGGFPGFSMYRLE